MKNILFLLVFCSTCTIVAASEVSILSPDKTLTLTVSVDKDVSFKFASASGEEIMSVKDIRMETDRGNIPAANSGIRNTKKASVDRIIKPEIKEKRAEIREAYNEAVIELKDKTKIQFRVYNDGMAYRLVLNLPGEITITGDRSDFLFASGSTLTFQRDSDMNSPYENPYVTRHIDKLENNVMGNLPALVKKPSGYNIIFLEADTKDYPCMWLKKSGDVLTTHHWNIPVEYNDNDIPLWRTKVVKTGDYIARTQASRTFPWKAFAVAEKDVDLLENQLVYLLGEACKIEDPSWIRPGWVTFDWWARRGIYGVDFKGGVNTATAKYMIDFAAEFGIQYFLFDEGWTLGEDLTKTIPEVDMPEVVRYARTKNVDVMLWVTYCLFDEQMGKALNQFTNWGIKGVKIDFMNRSDQKVVGFYWRAAEECAKHKMVIDFHGAYRPDGLRREYPNVLTREALIEFEYNGWTYYDTPDHHCTLPFVRGVAGPMDYIPGTMINAAKDDFHPNADTPPGQGTRAHSMAMAVMIESPMQMLPDAPSDYYRERECTEFLTQIPTEWDEIVPLDGKVGDYVALARRKDRVWYAAAITNWDARTMVIDFSFLEPGKTYRAEIIKDGVNADSRAIDYKKENTTVRQGDRMTVNLASGGGWIARITESETNSL